MYISVFFEYFFFLSFYIWIFLLYLSLCPPQSFHHFIVHSFSPPFSSFWTCSLTLSIIFMVFHKLIYFHFMLIQLLCKRAQKTLTVQKRKGRRRPKVNSFPTSSKRRVKCMMWGMWRQRQRVRHEWKQRKLRLDEIFRRDDWQHSIIYFFSFAFICDLIYAPSFSFNWFGYELTPHHGPKIDCEFYFEFERRFSLWLISWKNLFLSWF